jgi:hypothetical protein
MTECELCDDVDCSPGCPKSQWKRGLDSGSILRDNWQNGRTAIFIGDPPYLAKGLGNGKCELHGEREGCEGAGELYEWKGQDPYTLRMVTKLACSTCFFQLELVRNEIESIDGY